MQDGGQEGLVSPKTRQLFWYRSTQDFDLGTHVVMDGSQSNSLDESHIKSLEKIIGGKTLFDNERDEFYWKH